MPDKKVYEHSFPALFFSFSADLQKLDITKNDLIALPSNFGELRKLEFLYAQHNDIAELPSMLGCVALKELLMANNFIKEIPADFCEQLPHLQVLDLRENKIERIPDEIAQLQALIRLDLANNAVQSLPNSLATLAHLSSLQLEGNPIRSIRRDILQSGTVRVLKLLRDRAGVDDRGRPLDEVQAKGCATDIGVDLSVFPDK